MEKQIKIDFLKCSIKENQLTIKDLFSQKEIDVFFKEYVKPIVEEEKKSFSNTLSQKFTNFIDEVLDNKKEETKEEPAEESKEEKNTSSKPSALLINNGIAIIENEKIGICKGNIVWAKGYLAEDKSISKAEALSLIAKLPKIDGKSWRLPTDVECLRLCGDSSRSNGSEAGGHLDRALRNRFESIGGSMHSASHLTQNRYPDEGYVKVVLDI